MARFPYKQVFIVALVLFANNFGSLMIFPILPFMVHDFFPRMAVSQIGNLGGFLASAFYLGSFAGGLMWGRLSDLYGRKPTMLAGIIGTSFSVLLFGTSMNFFWAISARFLWGFLNGNVGVAKAYLSEILASKDQPKGFAFVGISRGAARLLAPLVGGFLSCPAVKFHGFDNAFFQRFPYFLPCLVGILICGCCFAGTVLYLKEPRKKNSCSIVKSSSSDNMELITKDDTRANQGFVPDEETTQCNAGSSPATEQVGEESDLIISSNSDNGQQVSIDDFVLDDKTEQPDGEISIERGRKISSSLCESTNQSLPNDLCFRSYEHHESWLSFLCCCICCKQRSYRHLDRRHPNVCCASCKCTSFKVIAALLKQKTCGILVFMFGMMAFEGVLIMEIVPLLLVTDYNHGGFMLDSAEISLILTVVGVLQLVFLVLLYPRITARLGVRRWLQIGLFVIACSVVFLPLMTTLTGNVLVVLENSNSTLVEDKPTPTSHQETFYTSSKTVLALETRMQVANDRIVFLKPSVAKFLSHVSHETSQTPVLETSKTRLSTLPYKDTFHTFTESLGVKKASFTRSTSELTLDITIKSLSISLDEKTSAFQIYPTKVQESNCRNCHSSINVSATPEKTIGPKASLPEIPIGQCQFDGESGNKTEHLSVSQIPVKVWVVTGVIIGTLFTIQTSCFVSLSVLVGNSCERQVRGTMYGLTQTTASLGRFLAPMVGGSVFSWSQRNGLKWPMNYHFLFYCLAAILVVLFLLSTRLPRTLEQQTERVTDQNRRGNT